MAPWQAWLLLGFTATAILVIFFLRIQHRQVVVSSSLLWDRVLERRKRQSWLELLRRLISLLIALLIGLALVLSFTEAEIGGNGGVPRRVALVVDTSIGMAARTADGTTRFERAVRLVGDLLAGGSGADTFVVYDTDGHVVAPASRDRIAVLASLARLRPLASEFRFPALEDGHEVWLITDGVAARNVPATTRVLSVFEAADNVGVTAFEIRATPTDGFRHEAFLEVGNFSAGPQSVQIVMADEDQVQFRRTVQLQPNEYYQNTFDLSPLSGGALEARVTTAADALEIDDRAWVYLPRQSAVRILLVSERPSELEPILAAEGHVELVSMSGAEYQQWQVSLAQGGLGAMAAPSAADPSTFDGIVFDAYAPALVPPLPALLIRPGAADWLPEQRGTVTDVEDVTLVERTPLLQFVDLHDLHVERADRVDPANVRVLVDSSQGPLIVAGDGSAPWVMLSFDLAESDFSQSLGFPIFLDNTVQWFRGDADAIAARPGQVSVQLADAAVVTPDGNLAVTRSLPPYTVFDAAAPGIYMARAGGRTVPVVVSVTDRTTSAINERLLGIEPTPLGELPRGQALWRFLLPLVALLLVLEALTYHRRITV